MGDGSAPVSTPAPAAGETAQTQAPSGGESTETMAAAQAAPGKPAPASAPKEDPEIELDAGLKLKRSELRDMHKRRKELDSGAFQKMQEAAAERKAAAAEKAEAKALLDSLGKDYKAALVKAGKDPIKVAEQILQEALDEFQMSPAEREARAIKAENERLKAENAEREKTEQETQAAAQVAQWEQRFDAAFSSAISTAGLPKTARTVSRMAEKVDQYWGAGIQIPLEEIAAEIRADLIAERRELLSSLKDEQAADLFDDSELEIVRKLLLRKAQGPAHQHTPQNPQPSAPRKATGKGLTRAELDARISKRIGA